MSFLITKWECPYCDYSYFPTKTGLGATAHIFDKHREKLRAVKPSISLHGPAAVIGSAEGPPPLVKGATAASEELAAKLRERPKLIVNPQQLKAIKDSGFFTDEEVPQLFELSQDPNLGLLEVDSGAGPGTESAQQHSHEFPVGAQGLSVCSTCGSSVVLPQTSV